MTWFLLNMPLAALFILAWTLIPFWLVSRHSDTPPGTSGTARARASSHPKSPPCSSPSPLPERAPHEP